MGPHWIPNGTTKTIHPSLMVVEEKQKKATTSSDPSDKVPNTLPATSINMDPSKENPIPQTQWSKEVDICTLHTKFIPSNPTCLRPSKQDLDMIGDILKQMYIPNQATTYPSGLHISKCTNFKMVSNKTCPRLRIYDEGKKKCFKLCFNEEMLSGGQKTRLVNHSRN